MKATDDIVQSGGYVCSGYQLPWANQKPNVTVCEGMTWPSSFSCRPVELICTSEQSTTFTWSIQDPWEGRDPQGSAPSHTGISVSTTWVHATLEWTLIPTCSLLPGKLPSLYIRSSYDEPIIQSRLGWTDKSLRDRCDGMGVMAWPAKYHVW
jgi:hypothetical protein